jgi:gamma-glutamyltranspeptidase
MKGVVPAGHPRTAQAGADVLRDGGNAVDAAVACVLMSFVAESRRSRARSGRLHAAAQSVGSGPRA